MEDISIARTVPVTQDLTTEELRLSVLRGIERMYRVDKPLGTGVVLGMGEWGVLNDDGKVVRPGADPVPNTYLVFCGSERFDVKATGQVTLIMNSPIIVKSSIYDTTAEYHVGDYLTVKTITGTEAAVTPAAGDDPKLAKVQEVGTDYLVYEVLVG
jgi:hypothetical protein